MERVLELSGLWHWRRTSYRHRTKRGCLNILFLAEKKKRFCYKYLDYVTFPQVWKVAEAPEKDKYQYTHFAHKINSFDTAPSKLLSSDSRLRPDRYALDTGDMTKAGYEKSR